MASGGSIRVNEVPPQILHSHVGGKLIADHPFMACICGHLAPAETTTTHTCTASAATLRGAALRPTRATQRTRWALDRRPYMWLRCNPPQVFLSVRQNLS